MGGQNQYDKSRPTKGTADSWDKGFIEDKPAEEQNNAWSPVLLRKDENRKSGKALTNPLEGKVTSQTPSTVKTANGAVYRKSDIAQSKIKSPLLSQSTRNTKSSKGEQVKNKLGGKNVRLQETLDLENEDSYKKKNWRYQSYRALPGKSGKSHLERHRVRGIKPGCKTGETQQRWADVEYATTDQRKQSKEEK